MQLELQSLSVCNGTSGARALGLALPLGAPRAYQAAPGALTSLRGTRPGSAGARGGIPSLTWQA